MANYALIYFPLPCDFPLCLYKNVELIYIFTNFSKLRSSGFTNRTFLPFRVLKCRMLMEQSFFYPIIVFQDGEKVKNTALSNVSAGDHIFSNT